MPGFFFMLFFVWMLSGYVQSLLICVNSDIGLGQNPKARDITLFGFAI